MNPRRLAVCAVLLALTLCAPAMAQWSAAGDLSVVLPESAWENSTASDLRLGYRFSLPRSFHFHTPIFRPELTVGYLHLPPRDGDDRRVQKFRFGGGLRAGFFFQRVELFGMIHLKGAAGTGGLEPMWDAGPSLEYRLDRANVGVHAVRTWMSDEGWWELGAHYEYHWFW